MVRLISVVEQPNGGRCCTVSRSGLPAHITTPQCSRCLPELPVLCHFSPNIVTVEQNEPAEVSDLEDLDFVSKGVYLEKKIQ